MSNHQKNLDDQRLLADKQRIDAERKARAVMRNKARSARAAAAMAAIADPSLRPARKTVS